MISTDCLERNTIVLFAITPVRCFLHNGYGEPLTTSHLQVICWLIIHCVYRIWFDRLSNFPGPALAACTSYYWHYLTISGQRASKVSQWHLKYGEVIRITPNELSFVGSTAWKDIYGHKQVQLHLVHRHTTLTNALQGRQQLAKAEQHTVLVKGKPTWHILNAPDEVHSRQRRMLSYAFSDRAVSLRCSC